MTAVALHFTDVDFMDGVAELIDRWIHSGAGRTNQMLGDKVGVSGTTIGRWRTEKNPPDEEHRDALAREFGVSRGELDAAADVTARRIRRREKAKRSGKPAVVRFQRDEWLTAIEDDERLSDGEKRLLKALTGYYVDDDLVRIRSLERLASDWDLSTDQVREDLPRVLVSGYVRRVDLEDLEGWMLKLQFPH